MPLSRCPFCKQRLVWYDLIPFFSWFFLKGKCRFCQQRISWLYPFIELITAISCLLLSWFVSPAYVLSYFFLFSLLIITIRTDLEEFVILPHILLSVPFGWLFSFLKILPLSPFESITASITAYGFLWFMQYSFLKIRKKEGLGTGDLDLLALIGAFTGFFGIWITLLIGSLVGCLSALIYSCVYPQNSLKDLKIPFGPFLAFGAMIYIVWEPTIRVFLIG